MCTNSDLAAVWLRSELGNDVALSSYSALQGLWKTPFLAVVLGLTCIIRTLVEAKVSTLQSWIRAARLPLRAPLWQWAGAGSAPMPNPSDSSLSCQHMLRWGWAQDRGLSWQLLAVAWRCCLSALCTQGPPVILPKAHITYYISVATVIRHHYLKDKPAKWKPRHKHMAEIRNSLILRQRAL